MSDVCIRVKNAREKKKNRVVILFYENGKLCVREIDYGEAEVVTLDASKMLQFTFQGPLDLDNSFIKFETIAHAHKKDDDIPIGDPTVNVTVGEDE